MLLDQLAQAPEDNASTKADAIATTAETRLEDLPDMRELRISRPMRPPTRPVHSGRGVEAIEQMIFQST
ncbi:hypothetical protein GCM10010234_05910 [Streptomyces hawaiiensis]